MGRAQTYPRKVTKLIGLAPAPDFTERLIWKKLNKKDRESIRSGKVIEKKITKDFSYFYSKELFKRSKN